MWIEGSIPSGLTASRPPIPRRRQPTRSVESPARATRHAVANRIARRSWQRLVLLTVTY
jgi:hypothetical protein